MAQNNLPERLELGPLSPAQRRDVQKIKSAYEDFWSNLKFKKGWEKPAFAKEEVTWMLEIAAEVVVHIRTMLDAVNPGFKIRVLDGSAREYLWTVDKKPDSIHFLRDIIHQTFKNIDGYVEGLTAELLDAYIDQCFEYLDVHDTLTKEKEVQYIRVRCMEIYERVKDKYLQSESERLQQALALMKDRELASESAEWRKVMKSLHTIDQCLDDIIKLRESALRFKQQQEEQQQQQQQEAPIEEVQTPQPQEEPQSEQSPEITPEAVQEQSQKQEESQLEEQPQAEPQSEQQAEPQVEQVESQVTPQEPQQEQQVEEKQVEESTQYEETKSEDSTEPPLSEVAESQADSEEAFEDDESDTSSDSESERPPSLRASQDDSTMLSVLRVGDEIPRVQQQIAALNAELEKLGQNQDQQDTATALSQVSALQRRTNGAFETLFADLTSLDALDLHGSPKARAARKEQVNRIQALLSQLESMQDTLKGMRSHLMEKKQQQDEQKSKEEQAAKAHAAAAEQEAKEKSQPKANKEKQQSGPIVIHSQGQEDDEEEEEEESDVEEEEVVRKARWRSLKLQPRMDVEETEKAYIITSYIPGMDRDDISVSLGQNNTLVIGGFRCPSVEEELAMRQMIRQEYAQRARESLLLYGPVRHPKLTPEQEDALVLRAGAGRYGTFQKAFQLPFRGMHSKQINASYEGGVIKVVVPKKVIPPRRQAVPLPVKTRPPEPMHDPRAAMYGGYPGVFGGFPASTRPSRQARGPFYNDSDFWW